MFIDEARIKVKAGNGGNGSAGAGGGNGSGAGSGSGASAGATGHGATAGTSRSAADEFENLLRSAGFTQMSTETLPLSPPVICVLAASPGPDAKHAPQA